MEKDSFPSHREMICDQLCIAVLLMVMAPVAIHCQHEVQTGNPHVARHVFLQPTYAKYDKNQDILVTLRGIIYLSERDDGSAPLNKAGQMAIQLYKQLFGGSIMSSTVKKIPFSRFHLMNAQVVKNDRVMLHLWFGRQMRIPNEQKAMDSVSTVVQTNGDGYFETTVRVAQTPTSNRVRFSAQEPQVAIYSPNKPNMMKRQLPWPLSKGTARPLEPKQPGILTMRLPAELLQPKATGMTPSFKIQVGVSSDEQMQATTVRVSLLQPRSNVIVISDIDDTIKISHISGPLKHIISAAFFEAYKPVPFMPELYQSWVQQSAVGHTGISFHYISGAVWKLAPTYTDEFLDQFHFPAGTTSFKNRFMGIADAVVDSSTNEVQGFTVPRDSRTDAATQRMSTYQHKMRNIQRLLNTDGPNESAVTLVGDSTERDPEVYADIVRTYGWKTQNGGKIGCVLIHAVTPETEAQQPSEPAPVQNSRACQSLADTLNCTPGPAQIDQFYLAKLLERLNKLFGDIPGFQERVRVFWTGSDVSDFNVLHGTCYPAARST